MVTSIIEIIKTNKLLPQFWITVFANANVISCLVQVVVSNLSDGTFALLAKGRGHPFPLVEELITIMKPTMSMNCWGVYLKLGLPLRSDLPLLIYVESATSFFGLSGRFESHIYSMATCTS